VGQSRSLLPRHDDAGAPRSSHHLPTAGFEAATTVKLKWRIGGFVRRPARTRSMRRISGARRFGVQKDARFTIFKGRVDSMTNHEFN
jgi:hypothetical protein